VITTKTVFVNALSPTGYSVDTTYLCEFGATIRALSVTAQDSKHSGTSVQKIVLEAAETRQGS